LLLRWGVSIQSLEPSKKKFEHLPRDCEGRRIVRFCHGGMRLKIQ